MRARFEFSQSCCALRSVVDAQVLDHLVDDVLQLGDLAERLDGDLPRQVALGHGRGDVLDRADLGGQVARELVDDSVRSRHVPETPATSA